MNKSSIQIHNCYHLNNFRNEIKTAPKTTRSKQKPSKNISKRIKEGKNKRIDCIFSLLINIQVLKINTGKKVRKNVLIGRKVYRVRE